MKNLSFLLITTLCLTVQRGNAQSINWQNLASDQKHIATVQLGWDYSLSYGAGYAYQVSSKPPVLLTTSFSFPSGEKIFDDFKTKLGAQVRFWQIRQFHFSGAVMGIYRQYKNPLVHLQNLGAEATVVTGYYATHWHVAGEFGFDKAIATHFDHSKDYEAYVYDGVKDGWSAATGGNFSYGIQVGYSFKQQDLVFKIGKTITEDFNSSPLVPFYAQLGCHFKINGRKPQQ